MKYDENKYKVWKLPHPLVLHWVINPGVAINEVFLGQRLPKVMLIDKTSKAPLAERSYVPCPSCGELHDARLWSKLNAFGHWFGYVCPACKQKIPCLWNITSLLLLALLSPIWLPIKHYYERDYLAFEAVRCEQQRASLSKSLSKYVWVKLGLYFSVFMFLFMAA